jgi:hypothetical protein
VFVKLGYGCENFINGHFFSLAPQQCLYLASNYIADHQIVIKISLICIQDYDDKTIRRWHGGVKKN